MTISFSGILEIDRGHPKGSRPMRGQGHDPSGRERGYIRNISLSLGPTKADVFVPESLISRYNLRPGALVAGRRQAA